MLSIIHKDYEGKTYAQISAITKIPKEIVTMKAENPYCFFTFDTGLDFPENMPDWIRSIIQDSEEYKYIMDARADSAKIENNSSNWKNGEPDPEDMPF